MAPRRTAQKNANNNKAKAVKTEDQLSPKAEIDAAVKEECVSDVEDSEPTEVTEDSDVPVKKPAKTKGASKVNVPSKVADNSKENYGENKTAVKSEEPAPAKATPKGKGAKAGKKSASTNSQEVSVACFLSTESLSIYSEGCNWWSRQMRHKKSLH